MNHITKIALVSASLLSMGALTACQSTNTTKDTDQPQRMHSQKHDRNITPEQREQMQQIRAERHEMMKQVKHACDGKIVGSTVQIKTGNQTIDGTCTTVFKADRKNMKETHGARGEHHAMHRDKNRPMMMHRDEPLTDAKRAELTKQFDQRLAERQAKQQAVLKACQGKADGTAVQFKVGTQTIDGKCKIRFQPKMPAPTQVKIA